MQKVILFDQVSEYTDYIDRGVVDYIRDGQTETFEGFEGYSLVAFDWYDLKCVTVPPAQILVYIDGDDLFYICENERSFQAAEKLFVAHDSNEHALYLFFKNLLKGSTKYLEQLENNTALLDDDVADGTQEGLREQLTDARNEILRAKTYYEQLEFLFEEICDNDNGLFSDDGLKYFGVLRNRSVRLSQQAANLRDYIVQVRDAYQAQIGIEQNELMKLFTLVTSIFLPLTLIVGWYGMNLKMPEFSWDFGYLFVAGLCLMVCLVWLIYFKRKKWFR